MAFRDADLETASGLRRQHLAPAALLHARVALRASDPDRATASLATIGNDSFAITGECEMLRGAACTRRGDHEGAALAFARARVPVFAAAIAPLEAELEYYEALDAFVAGDVERARAGVERTLSVRPSLATHASQEAYVVPHAHTVARAHELLGALAVKRDDYAEQLVETDRALAALHTEPIRDRWIATTNLANLAVLVRDFGLTENVPALHAAAATPSRASALGGKQFLIVAAIGWCAALSGDQLGALRWFRRARDIARSVPDAIGAEVDLAWLAIEFERYGDARDAIERAVALANGFDWSHSSEDRQLALVALAQGAAASAPAAARRALETYRRTRETSVLHFTRFERRVVAEVAFAEGVVARAEGRISLAVDRLVAAFDTWLAIGYGWRAARAAIELDELGCGSRYAAYANRYARANPTSCIARRAAACGTARTQTRHDAL